MIGAMAMVDEPMGLRDRKKDRTRRRVHSTALALFAERGYDHVTVEDVADACELSRATIFRYFPTKEHLVVGVEPDRLADLRDAFEQRPADEPVFDSIRHALVAVAQRYEDDRDELLIVSGIVRGHPALQARAEGLRAEWRSAFAELILPRITRGRRAGLRARVLAGAVVAAMAVAVEEWLATDDPAADLADVLGEAMALLATGFDPR
jgi:AcrR family transcriptional regulator